MNVTVDPSGAGFVRYYERGPGTFRLTLETTTGIALVIGLHLLAGYFIVHSYFAQPPATVEPDRPNIITFLTRPPPPPQPQPKTSIPRPEAPAAAPTPRDLAPDTPAPPLDLAPIPLAPAVDGPAQSVPETTPAVRVAPSPPPPRVITNPTWISKPNADQMAEYYPASALAAGLSGKAVLICEIQLSGAMGLCQVTDETPRGSRFGEAAMAISRFFRMNPKAIDGVAVVGSKVRIPITFVPG